MVGFADALPTLRSLNDLDIYKDQVGKAPKITGAQWQDIKIPYGDPEIHERIGYVSGDTLQIKAKFSVEEKPQDIETIFTIIGNAKTSEGKTFLFEYEGATLKGDYVTTKPMSAKKALVKERTQFFNPLTIEWSMKYKEDGISKTKEIGKSKHQVYVTFDKPHEYLEKLYLSYLHWAVSNPGAMTKKEAVENTWKHFSKKGIGENSKPANLTTWDGRKLYYYPSGGRPKGKCGDPEYALTNPRGYGQCDNFAQLFEETLLLHNILPSVVEVSADTTKGGEQYMLINNWRIKKGTKPLFQKEGYDWWKLILFPCFPGAYVGCMTSPTLGYSFPEYGDFLNKRGLPAQNNTNPSEKVFEAHQIVRIPQKFLPSELKNTPYFDPSYGTTYQDEKDFEANAVFGYAKREDEIKDGMLLFRARKVEESELNIKFGTYDLE